MSRDPYNTRHIGAMHNNCALLVSFIRSLSLTLSHLLYSYTVLSIPTVEAKATSNLSHHVTRN